MRRLPIRRRHAAFAALSAGILITAGCGEDSVGKDGRAARAAQAAASTKVTLLPLGTSGPDPFTESTAAPTPDADSSPPPTAGPESGDPSGPTPGPRAPRSISGAIAGLYGGTKSVPSCDVQAQARLLAADRAKATAFARGAGVAPASVPTFLRGLTPVVLRADVRVTDHGYRHGAATAYQAVLQSGTAVLVDDRGQPRVRCAGGNPLRPATGRSDDAGHQGKAWSGYRPDRVVVVNRSTRVLTALVIVDTVDNTWLERKTGTDGSQDKKPRVPPPYPPDTDIIDPSLEPPAPDGSGSDSPDPGRSEPAVPEPDASESDRAPSPDCVTPDAPEPDEPWSESLVDPPDCSTAPEEPDSGVDPDYPVLPMSPERQGPDAPLEGDAGAPSDEDLATTAEDLVTTTGGDDPAGTVTLQD
ncbi:hypothetical protein GCM10011583_36000 [Streptomyces camponoticapitis]|uniref:DUF6777 domain-containing protein n=1 Tax=Streptomyces camponoticapitis TaxID=1616125 RepID=A0ABQ2E8V6_9ACTN|nr:DUF6777 domain-containing protein [Streptomyces camponoticapitis]GGK01277.1 hypothetical protein GCM10011583_36000 [Streptomyces camponoticapitis]